jgi:CRISPR-associated protein Cas1
VRVRVLVLKEYGVALKARRGLLLVEGRGVRQEIPPSDLDQVVILSGGVSVSSRAVRLLISHGVDLVFLDQRGLPVGRVYPPFINRTVQTRRAQYEAYAGPRRWEVVYGVVSAKIRNQAGLLRYFAKSRELPRLREAAEEVESFLDKLPSALGDAGRVINLEAQAARVYWSSVAELLPGDVQFEGRDPESLDPFNISLNYAYALLYSECWRGLVLAGLDPYAGFLHADRSGKESLVYDYSEMFKQAAVDKLLVKLFSSGWRPELAGGLLSGESRAFLVQAFKEGMRSRVRTSDGEAAPFEHFVKACAFELASFLRGERASYRGFVAQW